MVYSATLQRALNGSEVSSNQEIGRKQLGIRGLRTKRFGVLLGRLEKVKLKAGVSRPRGKRVYTLCDRCWNDGQAGSLDF